eukprot:398346_1
MCADCAHPKFMVIGVICVVLTVAVMFILIYGAVSQGWFDGATRDSIHEPTHEPSHEPSLEPTTGKPTSATQPPTTGKPTPATQPPTRPPNDCPEENQETYIEYWGTCKVVSKSKNYDGCDGDEYRWEYEVTTARCHIDKTCMSYDTTVRCDTRTDGMYIGEELGCKVRKNCDDDSCINCSHGFRSYDINIMVILSLLLIFIFVNK